MQLRHVLPAVSLLALFGCAERGLMTAPDAPVGAVAPQSVTHVVTTLDDFVPGSRRDRVANAGTGDVITFAPELAGGTITLLGAEIQVPTSMRIVGPEGGITISGANGSQIFRMGALFDVVLDNLTLRAGRSLSSGLGGAIQSSGNLTIRNSTIEDNWAPQPGGAIFSSQGALTIVNSTIAGNGYNADTQQFTPFGAGIYIARGTVTIVNSTISGNSAANAGGGIYNAGGSVTILHGTVANNGASVGGGILNYGTQDFEAVTRLENTIVAGNVSGGLASGADIHNFSQFAPDPEDHVDLSASHSLVGVATGHSLASTDGNLIGLDARFVLDAFGRPMLADNGGPTRTHSLREDSPAIDAAAASVCTAEPVGGRDQRGEPRPRGAGCDIGAYEADGAAPPPPAHPAVAALAVAASGTVDRTSGVAFLTGSMTCTEPGTVQLRVGLSQEQKQRGVSRTVQGETTISVECAGVTAWAAAVSGANGIFINGSAQGAAETLNADPNATASGAVRLVWSK
jgi:hypothetical protein